VPGAGSVAGAESRATAVPQPQRWTLTRYLIEERRRFPDASGDLNALILDVALACKSIARIAGFGPLVADRNPGLPNGSTPPAQEDRAALAHRAAHDVLARMNECNGHLAGMASEALDAPLQIPQGCARGKYLLVFDPLDGSGNIDVNAPLGSLFSILRAPAGAVESGRDVIEADFLQPGALQVAAGYAIYGPSTMLVLSVGNGVAGFTLHPDLAEFVLTHPGLRVPEETQEFAINTGHARLWEPPVKRYVDECLAGRSGPRGRDFHMRWIASTVAEAHRILLRGGVFLAPRAGGDAAAHGRLRLLHEANPVAMVMEQAGGRASTGRQPVLGVRPDGLHQRIGLVYGSRQEVERIERYHRDRVRRDVGHPLFTERSLFRD
jgi:fructose-1,6-bisphosphatase I/sedoheptulose-1,7-bisphosphatase